MEYLAVSPSTGMIADIFLAEIIPSGMARFLRARNSSILPPENKHVSHVEEERERKEKMVGMGGPKKRITLTISVAL